LAIPNYGNKEIPVILGYPISIFSSLERANFFLQRLHQVCIKFGSEWVIDWRGKADHTELKGIFEGIA